MIELDGTALTFSEREGIYSDRLEVVVMPLNSKGEPENVDRVAADMKLKPETYEAVLRGGVRLMSRLDLHPGPIPAAHRRPRRGRRRDGQPVL